jgi:hypothetical protein
MNTKTQIPCVLLILALGSSLAQAQQRSDDRNRSNDRRTEDRRSFDRRDRRTDDRRTDERRSEYSTTPTTPSSQPSSTQPSSYRDHYYVLVERNIFLKERRRPTGPAGVFPRTERQPEQTYALTGIVEEDGQYRAYFEHSGTSSASFVRTSIGDPIARGKVTDITIDAVEYEQEGQRRWIVIGYDLTGSVSARSTPSAYTSGSATSPTTGPSDAAALNFDPNDPNLTAEQKMKVRRMREQGLLK